MSLLFFYRSNYWRRLKPEYRFPEAEKPRRKKKRSYKVVYDRGKAQALNTNVSAFAKELEHRRKIKRRQKDEESLFVMGLL